MNENINLSEKTDHELAVESTELAVERTRLSSQRTYLSWVRTGLACVGGGIALLRLLTFDEFKYEFIAQCVGAVLILLGITIFALALADYQAAYKRHLGLSRADFAGSIFVTSVISITLGILALLLLMITFHPVARQ